VGAVIPLKLQYPLEKLLSITIQRATILTLTVVKNVVLFILRRKIIPQYLTKTLEIIIGRGM
jgi:hypothetical protein